MAASPCCALRCAAEPAHDDGCIRVLLQAVMSVDEEKANLEAKAERLVRDADPDNAEAQQQLEDIYERSVGGLLCSSAFHRKQSCPLRLRHVESCTSLLA